MAVRKGKKNSPTPSYHYNNDDEVEKMAEKIVGNEEDDEEEEPSFIQWITRGNNVYYPEAHVKLVKKIPAGYFTIGFDQQVNKFTVRKISYSADKVFKLPMPETDEIIKDINSFWKNQDAFKRYGLTYKRGMLMYGPPGSGKSHIIQLIVKHLIEKEKGVVFKIESPPDVETFQGFMNSTFKPIEPNRRIVVIIEDIDGLLMSGKHTETLLLNILDGMGQMDNVVYLATTNYPEELPERIMNRPSRFDRRYEIGLPDEKVRRSYFEQALLPQDLKVVDLNQWVDESDGLSIAHLREIMVSTLIQGNGFEDTMKLMKEYNEQKPSSKRFKGTKTIGFGGK